MPVRQIPKKASSLSGVLASAKNGRSIGFESSLERDFYLLLEFDPEVIAFEEQPVQIAYFDAEGQERHYTPDTLVRFRGNPERVQLHEIKYRDDLQKKLTEFRPRFRAACHFAREHGWKFRITTEATIHGPLLDNAKFLLPFRNRAIAQEEIDRFLSALNERDSLTVSEWLALLARSESQRLTDLPIIWHLISTGKVLVDLKRKITPKSRVWFPGATP